MIKKTHQKRHDRLYFKPDADSKKCPRAMAAENAKATFTLRDEEHQLTYDGKVDDIVLDGLKPAHRECAVQEIRSLAGALNNIEAARQQMDAGESTAVDFGEGQTWTGEQTEVDGRYGTAYEFKSGAQSAIFSTLDKQDISMLQLRTRGDGMSQDITAMTSGTTGEQPNVYYFAEGVTVFARHKSKKAK